MLYITIGLYLRHAYLKVLESSSDRRVKKERTHQLNNKFDKTYKIFFKILSQFDIRRKSQCIWITNGFYSKSFH